MKLNEHNVFLRNRKFLSISYYIKMLRCRCTVEQKSSCAYATACAQSATSVICSVILSVFAVVKKRKSVIDNTQKDVFGIKKTHLNIKKEPNKRFMKAFESSIIQENA